MTTRFVGTIIDVSKEHDLVIIGTPPVLVVTDDTVIARQAAVALIAFRAGQYA
jgi:Mrp family chromosome partitioning ATPase